MVRPDMTVDEFIGVWWDRHATRVYPHDQLVAKIPLLVKWVLPHLGTRKISALSPDELSRYRRTLNRHGAPELVVCRCTTILEEILTCAQNWGLAPRSPSTTATDRAHVADVVPITPSRRLDQGRGPWLA